MFGIYVDWMYVSSVAIVVDFLVCPSWCTAMLCECWIFSHLGCRSPCSRWISCSLSRAAHVTVCNEPSAIQLSPLLPSMGKVVQPLGCSCFGVPVFTALKTTSYFEVAPFPATLHTVTSIAGREKIHENSAYLVWIWENCWQVSNLNRLLMWLHAFPTRVVPCWVTTWTT